MIPAGPNPFGDRPDLPLAVRVDLYPDHGGEIFKAELVNTVPLHPERLSILYLMIWTAGSAVILAFYRQALVQSSSPSNPLWLQTLYALLMSPLQGAGVGAVALMAWRRFRGGRPFPTQPGHWLLVITGVMALLTWPAYLLNRAFAPSSFGAYVLIYRVPLAILFFILAGYVMTRLRAEPRWRKMILFWAGANALSLALLCVTYFGYPSYHWATYPELLFGAIVPAGFLVTAWIDRAHGVQRDALHWAGVLCRIAFGGQVMLSLVRMFLPRP